MTDNTPYIPAADEPSVFSPLPQYPNEDWSAWKRKQLIAEFRAEKDSNKTIPGFLLCYDGTIEVESQKARMAIWLMVSEGPRPDLPEERPAMFLPGTRIISQAWVIDEMLRFDVSPETAMITAEAVKARAGVTLHEQQWWLAWFDWMFKLKDQDIQIRMTVQRDNGSGKFRNFTGCVGNYSKTVLISERVGDGGRIRQPVATLSKLDGEILANFTNEHTFGEMDVGKFMKTLIVSAGYVDRG